MEDPGYFVLFEQLRAHHVRLIPVPRHAAGPDLAVLEGACRAHRPRAFFMQTLLHNPTGSSAEAAHCHRILSLAEQFGFAIIEDDVYGDLYQGPAVRLAGGHKVGGARGDAVLHQAGGDVLAQLDQPLRRARQPRLRPAVADEARELTPGHRLEQPVLGQKPGTRGDQVRALRERQARERECISARVRQRLDGREGHGGASLRNEEAAPGARIDQAACHQALVSVDDREGAHADLARQAADRGQAGARGELLDPYQLRETLADLLHERDL